MRNEKYPENRKKNAMIYLEWDKEIDPISSSSWAGQPMVGLFDDEDNDTDLGYESQLMVTVLNGGTLSIDDIYDYDDLTRGVGSHTIVIPSIRKTKAFNRISKILQAAK